MLLVSKYRFIFRYYVVRHSIFLFKLNYYYKPIYKIYSILKYREHIKTRPDKSLKGRVITSSLVYHRFLQLFFRMM